MEQKEEHLIKRLENIAFNLEADNIDMHFEQFLQLEASFNAQFKSFYGKYMRRYEQLAAMYLLKVIKNSRLKYQNQQTFIQYSYFSKQSMKIKNTRHFHFHDCLKEMNFFHFLKNFHTGISERAQLELPYLETNEESRLEALIKSNTFCNRQCIGCNSFFYQFQPIELGSRKEYYKTEFLGNFSNERSQTGLKVTQQIEYNLERKIDLSNLSEKKSEENLLKLITSMLKQKGGFILIGCKRIQQFINIKTLYAYEQINQDYMNIRFVIGQSLTLQQQNKIRNELRQITQKKITSVQFGKNIDVFFVPIKKTPFILGYGFQKLILNNALFEAKQLHLVVIKVHPTEPKQQYEYVLGQDNEVFYDEVDQDLAPDDYNDKQLKRLNFLDQISFDMDEQDQQREQLFLKDYRSYFDIHTCKPLPYHDEQK